MMVMMMMMMMMISLFLRFHNREAAANAAEWLTLIQIESVIFLLSQKKIQKSPAALLC